MSGKLKHQDIPAEDLSDLGSPAPRGSGLSGLLTTTPAPAPDQPLAETRVGDPAEAPRPPVSPRSVRSPRQSSTRSRTRPTTAVYVSQGVKQRFEDYRHKAKKTNLQVVLEAITAKHADLTDIIKRSEVSTAPVGGSLFPADPSAVRYLGGGSVQIGFSPTPEQENVLDSLGRELGFTTRSTWIAPVLNAFLPGKKDT
ncbi:hypothetical protein MycrhDRAFT_6249 [Mycolicibacterium rhodesiae JS60]|nr:hypothetical protein MycrhDRAFT_6249 [Mycolicibacterium rhodesiae JS60]